MQHLRILVFRCLRHHKPQGMFLFLSAFDCRSRSNFLPYIVMTRKTPLRSNKPLLRKTRLRPASPKRKKQYDEYKNVRKAYLALHPTCERCRVERSTDIHHKAQRYGALLNNWELFAALCRACHDFLHQNAREARKQGWIVDLPAGSSNLPTV